MDRFRSPMYMAAAVVVAVICIIVGIIFQVGPHTPGHVVSYHAIAFWGLAVVALIGASFARPQAR